LKRHLLPLLGLAVALTVALAPAGLQAAFGPRYGGVLRVGVLDLSPTPDPSSARGLGARLLLTLRHETLVRASTEGILPSLALGWSSAAGGREWTLDLASGARFHKGGALTSEDALRSLRRFLRAPSPDAELLAADLDGGAAFRNRQTEGLPGLASPTSGRLVLRFIEPQAALPAALASPSAAITNAEGDACGPFRLAHAMGDERAILLTFDQHVRGRPLLDQIELIRLPDLAALRRARERGEIDLAFGEPASGPKSGRLLLLLDASRTPFRAAEARRRLAATVDRQVFVRRFFPDGEPTCRPLGEALAAGDEACGATVGTSGAGAPRRESIVLGVDSSVPASASQRVVAQFLAVGYRVSAHSLPADRLASAEVDARLIVFTPEVDDPVCALQELAALAGQTRALGTRLIEAQRAPRPGARRKLLAAAEHALLDTHAVIPLAATPLLGLGSAHVMDMTLTPGGRLLLEESWLPL
jgi:MarR-like DNA-binding transcriptional regulator SgrR of sgrS sRNA